MIRVAINGFGRIGRQAAKIMLENQDVFKVVAVNDLTNPEALANLLKYDSVYGVYEREVSSDADEIIIDKKKIKVYSEKDPADLPWREDKIDVVIESTGFFTKKEDASKHISAGAKNVVISAPSKGDNPAPTFLRGLMMINLIMTKSLITPLVPLTVSPQLSRFSKMRLVLKKRL